MTFLSQPSWMPNKLPSQVGYENFFTVFIVQNFYTKQIISHLCPSSTEFQFTVVIKFKLMVRPKHCPEGGATPIMLKTVTMAQAAGPHKSTNWSLGTISFHTASVELRIFPNWRYERIMNLSDGKWGYEKNGAAGQRARVRSRPLAKRLAFPACDNLDSLRLLPGCQELSLKFWKEKGSS